MDVQNARHEVIRFGSLFDSSITPQSTMCLLDIRNQSTTVEIMHTSSVETTFLSVYIADFFWNRVVLEG